ncbi:hypothetical protein KC19_9G130600 [Ceratodon purpureus]|uniref:Uncharacterized protein n=1 Tax=Ceratodon purpureus TaxID=3225 RepID=A0A8T0GVT7_CERPU|nr:hypothetical protein KC19_9G130600 [Ceratodon purpureus]
MRSRLLKLKESAALDHAKMECREVQDEYEVHVAVVGSCTPLYLRLRFALLASTWLPSSLGALAWSVLHVLLVVVAALYFLSVVILILIWDIVLHFFLAPVFYSIVALWDIVVLIMDTLNCIFLTIRVTVSYERTPGETKAAYTRLGPDWLFFNVRLFLFDTGFDDMSNRWLIPFLYTFERVQESWSGSPCGCCQLHGEPLKLQMKRWCEEIVCPTTTFFVP